MLRTIPVADKRRQFLELARAFLNLVWMISRASEELTSRQGTGIQIKMKVFKT